SRVFLRRPSSSHAIPGISLHKRRSLQAITVDYNSQLPGNTPVFRNEEGQSFSITHSAQSGLRALQIARPWEIIRCGKITHSFFGTMAIRSCSIFSAVFCSEIPSRCESLVT